MCERPVHSITKSVFTLEGISSLTTLAESYAGTTRSPLISSSVDSPTDSNCLLMSASEEQYIMLPRLVLGPWQVEFSGFMGRTRTYPFASMMLLF